MGEFLTLLDWAKRSEKGKISRKIVERMATVDPFWETVPFTKANDGWDHLVTYRTDLPEPVFTAIYEGAPFTKSQTDQVKYSMGFADDWIVVPTRLADKGGDRVEFMKSEAEAHGQGFGKKIEQTILYGNRATNPREFTGLATMFNDAGLDNVLDCDGTGSSLTSLWLVVFGEKTCFGIFPEEGKPIIDIGKAKEDEVADDNGNEYQVLKQHLGWTGGIAVEDPRYVVRIANIDMTTAVGSSTLDDLIIDAYTMVPDFESGKAIWMGNRQLIAYLVKMAKAQANVQLDWEGCLRPQDSQPVGHSPQPD